MILRCLNNFENDASLFDLLYLRTGRLDKIAHCPHRSGCTLYEHDYLDCIVGLSHGYNNAQFYVNMFRLVLCDNKDNYCPYYLFLFMINNIYIYIAITVAADIDDCANNPCQQGAACADGLHDYSCDCPNGYTGKECHIGTSHLYYEMDGT